MFRLSFAGFSSWWVAGSVSLLVSAEDPTIFVASKLTSPAWRILSLPSLGYGGQP